MTILRAAPLSEHRTAIASRVLARAAQPLFVHKCQQNIVQHDKFDVDLRALALAIMRVELLERPLHRRLFEYAILPFSVRLRPSLTIGPAQMHVEYLRAADLYCTCGCLDEPPAPLVGILRTTHYVTRFLSYLESLRKEFGKPRIIANAYQKGRDATDLHMPTVYSEVVSALALKYAEHIASSA